MFLCLLLFVCLVSLELQAGFDVLVGRFSICLFLDFSPALGITDHCFDTQPLWSLRCHSALACLLAFYLLLLSLCICIIFTHSLTPDKS